MDEKKFVSKQNIMEILTGVKKYVDDTSASNTGFTIDSDKGVLEIVDGETTFYATIFSKVEKPNFDKTSGEGLTKTDLSIQNVTISGVLSTTDENAKMYYSFDNTNWTQTTGGITIPASEISKTQSNEINIYAKCIKIYAKCIKSGIESDVESKTFTLSLYYPAPTVTATGNDYSTSRTISISLPTGATGKYSTDGGTNYTNGSSATQTSESNTSKTYNFVYTKDGVSSKPASKTVVTGKPQIYTYASSTKLTTLDNLDNWTPQNIQTLTNGELNFYNINPYYCYIAVPESVNELNLSCMNMPVSFEQIGTYTIGNTYKIFIYVEPFDKPVNGQTKFTGNIN